VKIDLDKDGKADLEITASSALGRIVIANLRYFVPLLVIVGGGICGYLSQ